MSPKAGESNLFRQDDVYGVLRLLRGDASRLPQQVFPLLPDKPAVLDVGQPRLAAAEEHDPGGSQDDQAGDQRQHSEADQLPVGDQDAAGVHRLLQGDLQQVPLRRPEELVEGVSGEGVVLRGQRQHPVVPRPGGGDLRPMLLSARGSLEPPRADAAERTVGLGDARAPVAARRPGAGPGGGGGVAGETGEPALTGAGEGQAEAGAVAAVEAGVGLTAVNGRLAEVSGKSRGTRAGGGSGRAIGVHARASVLTRRAGGQRGAR